MGEKDPVQSVVVTHQYAIGQMRAVDLLFVVDDSMSMADKQENLRANFANFVNVIDTVPNGRPDLHIGVVSTDLGARGTLDDVGATGIPGCTGNGREGRLQRGALGVSDLDGDFLVDVRTEHGRTINYAGFLSDTVGRMAMLGADGCEYEQPLEAMRRALTNPDNAGFLRDDAYLMIVFLTDEDDCSFLRGSDMLADDGRFGPRTPFRCTQYGVTCDDGGQTPEALAMPGAKDGCRPATGSPLVADVGPYIDFLRALKSDPAKVFLSGIAGDVDPLVVEAGPTLGPACASDGGTAAPAIRLGAVLDAFPDRAQRTSICQTDLSAGLLQFAQMFKVTLGAPCLEGELLDAAPDEPGLQPSCAMWWDLPSGRSERIPACTDVEPGEAPCFVLDGETSVCPPGSHYIGTRQVQPPLPGTTQTLQCEAALPR